MADWLTEALRAQMAESAGEDLTPFQKRFRSGMVGQGDSDDWLSRDPHVQKGLAELASGTSIAKDARDVLGDAADELTEEILEELDSLVKITRSKGGMVLKASDEDIGSLRRRTLERLGKWLEGASDAAVRNVSNALDQVMQSETGEIDLFTGILLSQLRHKLRQRVQRADGITPEEYRAWLAEGDEALRSRGEDLNQKTDWQREIGNPE